MNIFNIYLFVLILLLPLDYFTFSAEILREYGSKPSSIILTAGSLVGFYHLNIANKKINFWDLKLLKLTLLAIICGISAYGFSVSIIESEYYLKNSFEQFVFHLGMIILALLSVVGNRQLFYNRDWKRCLDLSFLVASVIFLFGFYVQLYDLIPYDSYIFKWFHIGESTIAERPTSFFTEPSYYGTMGAMYAGYLIIERRSFRMSSGVVLVATLLIITSFSIGAKTFLPVFACGLLTIHLSRCNRFISKKQLFIELCFLVTAFLYVNSEYSVFNLFDNLSSAMRFGSTHLSLNLIFSGYSILGIGPGQFHYLYLPEYAPDYLLATEEAYAYFTKVSEYRASTYNFFSRVFLELGIVFFLVFCSAVFSFIRKIECRESLSFLYLFGCSLGFLLTQDTYYYPPLVLSTVLIISSLEKYKS